MFVDVALKAPKVRPTPPDPLQVILLVVATGVRLTAPQSVTLRPASMVVLPYTIIMLQLPSRDALLTVGTVMDTLATNPDNVPTVGLPVTSTQKFEPWTLEIE